VTNESGTPKVNWYSLIGRELTGMPEEWTWYSARALQDQARTIEIKGGIAPLFTRGKRKGDRNWAKRDRTKDRTVYMTMQQVAERQERWGRETSTCFMCQGTQKEWTGWSVTEGVKYKPCTRCRPKAVAA
jgi:hypothetical protein